MNGQLLPIDPAVFATSGNCGTIVDSGTTLAYLVPEAYEPFVSAVSLSIITLLEWYRSPELPYYLLKEKTNLIWHTALADGSLTLLGSIWLIGSILLLKDSILYIYPKQHPSFDLQQFYLGCLTALKTMKLPLSWFYIFPWSLFCLLFHR